MLRQLKDSPEAPALKESAAQHLRDSISEIVQKDRQKMLRRERTRENGTPSGVQGSYVSPYIARATAKDSSKLDQQILGPLLQDNAFAYTGSLQGLQQPVPQPREPETLPASRPAAGES